ncbi:MAG: hypothetical protein LBR47_06770, partial [Spirochaetaceae bacterium]|nr:hypothetical protein [Spirochaetaceae bacterium]
MKHILFAFYIFLFTCGSSGIIALGIMSVREKSGIVQRLLGLQILLFLGLGVELAYYYLQSIIGISDPLLNGIAVVSNLIQSGLYIAAFMAIRSLMSGRGYSPVFGGINAGLSLIMVLISAAAVVFFLLPLLGVRLPFDRWPLPAAAGYSLTGITFLFLAICLLWASPEEESRTARFLRRGWGYSLLLFIFLSLLERMLKLFADLNYAPVSFDNIFFVCSGVVSVIACVRALYQERDIPEKPGILPCVEVTEETAARFQLTLRERELVPHIARGLANK